VTTSNVPIKTSEAVAELSSRQRRLSQRHRTVLLLVDGRRAEEEVRKLAVQAGSPDSCFDELLELGMISRPVPLEPAAAPASMADLGVEPLDAPASVPPDSVLSVLPASLSLQPESTLDAADTDLRGVLMHRSTDADAVDAHDGALEEARAILMRAVRAEAPVAGSLTLLRLRRARTREDIERLLQEVESRIFKPFKGLWASQTMARVRELLASQAAASVPSP